jgi:hypothetical protein
VKDLAVRRKTLGSVVLVIACALIASGCSSAKSEKPNGITDLAPIPAFQRAVNATQDATDVIARGALPVNGKAAVVETRFSGPNASATVKSKASTFQVIRTGQFIYVRASVEFWTPYVGRPQAVSINTRWAQSLVDGPLAQFNFFVDKNIFFKASGRIKKGTVVDLNGKQAFTLIDPPSNTDSTWWVSTTGEPVMLKWTSGKKTKYTFSYDDVNVVTAPPAGETVNINDVKIAGSTPEPVKTQGP